MRGLPSRRTGSWGRSATVVLTVVGALLLGACSSGGKSEDKPPEFVATAWDRVMAMAGPDGSVSKDMALSAFATAFGSVPGAQAQPGSREDLTSGSAAMRWIWGHWGELSTEQRDAVSRISGWGGPPGESGGDALPRVGPAAALTPAAVHQHPLPCPVQAVVNPPALTTRVQNWWPKLAAKIGVPGPVAILTCQMLTPFSPAPGTAAPPNVAATGMGVVNAQGQHCQLITYAPFNDPRRTDAERDELMIHELGHCAEALIHRNVTNFGAMATWVGEGLADWMAAKLAGHFRGPSKWKAYLVRHEHLLTRHSYSALGFWWELDYRGVDVWSTGRAAVAASARNGVTMNDAAYAAALGGKRQHVLEGWPSSYTRDIGRDPGWDVIGVGITGDKVTLKNPARVGSSKRTVPIGSPAYNPTQQPLDITAEVLRLSPGSGAAAFGRFGPGEGGDYPLSRHMSTIFCTLGSKCECPKDTPGASTTFERISAGRGVIAVSGGEHDASVGLTGQTLADFCGEPKKTPTPTKPPGGGSGAGRHCLAACPEGPRGGSNGDPHMTTFDRLFYDFQASGEFNLVASRDDDLRVQVRQVPVQGVGDVSVNTAVAAMVAGSRVTFTLAGQQADAVVRLDGRPVAPAPETPLPGGGTLVRSEDGPAPRYALSWPDSTTLFVRPIGEYGLEATMALAEARKGRVQGLLGDGDGNRDNDLDMGGGRFLTKPSPTSQPPFAEVYGPFANNWRVRQETSLFDYESGQSTANFTDRSFPKRPTDLSTLPNAAAARERCVAAGVSGPEVLDGCILDVALTGREEFAQSAADQEEFVDAGPEPTPPPRGAKRLGPFSGDATCVEGVRVTLCRGELVAGQTSATIRFTVEGFDKLSFFAPPDTDCSVQYSISPRRADDLILESASLCEEQAVLLDQERREYTLTIRSPDPSRTFAYSLNIGVT